MRRAARAPVGRAVTLGGPFPPHARATGRAGGAPEPRPERGGLRCAPGGAPGSAASGRSHRVPALHLGPLALGPQPRIAVPFDGSATREAVAALRQRGLDVAELRLDLFAERSAAALQARLADFAGLPTLATIRLRAEGGGWDGPEGERLDLYRALLPAVDGVDVELAAPIRDEVLAAAREAGRLSIASHHDFAGTPAPEALAEILARGRAAGADVVKIAAAVSGRDDLRALAGLLVAHPDVPMIVVGMGEAALVSRVLFPALGSLLTYAHAGRATAPGQIPFDELRALLARLVPGYPPPSAAS